MSTKTKKSATKARQARAVIAKAKPEKAAATEAKIKLLVKDNPKREGSASYNRFELYKSSKTVSEFIAAGGTRADLAWDAARGYIAIAPTAKE